MSVCIFLWLALEAKRLIVFLCDMYQKIRLSCKIDTGYMKIKKKYAVEFVLNNSLLVFCLEFSVKIFSAFLSLVSEASRKMRSFYAPGIKF